MIGLELAAGLAGAAVTGRLTFDLETQTWQYSEFNLVRARVPQC